MKHSLKLIMLSFAFCLALGQITQIGEPFETILSDQTIYQTPYSFTQKIDHFNHIDQKTFKQRFAVYNPGFDQNKGTVFIYICPEVGRLGLINANGFTAKLAQQFNGIVFALEHRFYGGSQPFGSSKNPLSVENLAYLNTSQALADVANFITYIKANKFLGVSDSNPFISVGGSYSGALSAWFRQSYPDLVVGAYGGSATVEAVVDYQQYDYQIYTSTLKSGEWCPTNIQSFNKKIEGIIKAGGKQARQIKESFGMQFVSNNSFIAQVQGIYGDLVQSGNRRYLCTLFETDDFNTQLDNLSAYFNPKDVQKNMAKYEQLGQFKTLKHILKRFNQRNIQEREEADPVLQDSERQWNWQVCTEFGWFNTANSIEPMISSEIQTLKYWKDNCVAQFGLHYANPDVNKINQTYQGSNLLTTNVIITNGVEDGWQWASIRSDQNGVRSFISDCDDCAHCIDLQTPKEDDDPNLKKTRQQIQTLMKQWVETFYANQQLNKQTSIQLLLALNRNIQH